MARREKKPEEKKGSAWLVTFSDLMTLLLTFFVLLLSMAVIDERRVREVLFTVRGSLGIGTAISTPVSDKNTPRAVIPGVFDLPTDDLEPLRDMLWDDPNQDVTLLSNRYIEIISVSSDVLFAPGETSLTAKGQALLGRIAPVLRNLDYPILLAGHTSPARDEVDEYRVTLDPYELSSTWEISFLRAMAVYILFKDLGLPSDKMMVEGFGESRPRVSNNTPVGRATNRRVDIVLDKRNKDVGLTPEDTGRDAEKGPRKSYEQNGFIFDLNPPAGVREE